MEIINTVKVSCAFRNPHFETIMPEVEMINTVKVSCAFRNIFFATTSYEARSGALESSGLPLQCHVVASDSGIALRPLAVAGLVIQKQSLRSVVIVTTVSQQAITEIRNFKKMNFRNQPSVTVTNER